MGEETATKMEGGFKRIESLIEKLTARLQPVLRQTPTAVEDRDRSVESTLVQAIVSTGDRLEQLLERIDL